MDMVALLVPVCLCLAFRCTNVQVPSPSSSPSPTVSQAGGGATTWNSGGALHRRAASARALAEGWDPSLGRRVYTTVTMVRPCSRLGGKHTIGASRGDGHSETRESSWVQMVGWPSEPHRTVMAV